MNEDETSLQRFLDGLMDESEREQFEAVLATDQQLSKQVEQQREIDAAIRSQFQPPKLDLNFLDGHLTEESAESPTETDLVEQPLHTSEGPTSVSLADAAENQDANDHLRRAKTRRFALLFVAASIAWAVVGLQIYYSNRADQRLAFRPQPLTELYRRCLADGFDPYWVCDDEEVFATTFQSRQGVPLILANLPNGRSMVGLSYLAGISRNSTSILARVDGVPVIVFVDRLRSDWKPDVGSFDEQGLSVFRSQRDQLVFYEVSPFDQPMITPYLTPRDDRPNDAIDLNRGSVTDKPNP